MESQIEEGRAQTFYTWLGGVSRDYSRFLLTNECFEWESLEDMDGDTLQYMGITNRHDQQQILSKIGSIKSQSSEDYIGSGQIETGKATMFYAWLETTFAGAAAEMTGALTARGYTTWAVLSSLDRQVLHESGVRKVGVQQKMLKKIKALVTMSEPGSDMDSKEPDVPHRHGSSSTSSMSGFVGGSGPRQNIGLVLLGETGAGKSTFFQALTDRAKRTSFRNIQDTLRNPSVGATESQTKKSKGFVVPGPGYVLNIIDTPGIGDTVGIDEDRRHIDNITKFLSKDCDFNAICMIIKNGQNRATHRMAYIISEIKANLTTDVWPQVFTVVTRCAKNRFPGDDTCAVIEKLGLPGPETDRFFLVDNYAYERVEERRRPRQYLLAKERAYEEAGEQLDDIIRAASTLPLQTGARIGELREQRGQCTVLAKDMQMELRNIQAKEASLRETKALLQRNQSEAELNRNFKSTRPQDKSRKIFYPNDGKATICFSCDSRCHDPCYLRVKGVVEGCSAFNSNNDCTQCNHASTSHKHEGFYYETYTINVPVVNEAVKRKFEAATSQAGRQRILLQSIESELVNMRRTRQRLTREIAEIYVQIDTMAVESFNEFFPKYIEELKADLDNQNITAQDKRRRSADFDLQIRQYNEVKGMYLRTKRGN